MVDIAVERAAQACETVIVVVAEPTSWDGDTSVVVVRGGATRSASVRAGLDEVPSSADVVVVHDAARPLADLALWRAVIDAVRAGADGAVPGLPMTDTVKRVDRSRPIGLPVVGSHVGGSQVDIQRVVATVDRSDLVAVQTPQAFRTAALRAAHVAGHDATDDAALLESTGGLVVVVPGDPRNLKVTTASDLVVANAMAETMSKSAR